MVVADLTESAGFVRDNPDFRCVTADGDLIGAHWAHGGSAGAQSLLDVRAAADDAAAKLAAAETASEAAAETLAEATEATDEARQVLEEIRGRLPPPTRRRPRSPVGSGGWPGPPGRPPTRPSGSTPPSARPSAAPRRTRRSSPS